MKGELKMARKRGVNRTLVVTLATVLCADTEAGMMGSEIVSLSGAIKTKEEALKSARKIIETDDYKVVKVIDLKKEKRFYTMPEEDYIANASYVVVE